MAINEKTGAELDALSLAARADLANELKGAANALEALLDRGHGEANRRQWMMTHVELWELIRRLSR